MGADAYGGLVDRGHDRFDKDARTIALFAPESRTHKKHLEEEAFDAALGRLLRSLTARMRRQYPVLGDGVQDVAAQALDRYRIKAATGDLRDHPNPPAYLVVTAHNEMLRYLRKHDREEVELERVDAGISHHAAEVDDLDRLTDRLDAELDVAAAIAAAWRAGDLRAAGVLQAFLDLARAEGATPSNRSIASEADVSHPTVGTVLEYAATWLAERGAWARVPSRR